MSFASEILDAARSQTGLEEFGSASFREAMHIA